MVAWVLDILGIGQAGVSLLESVATRAAAAGLTAFLIVLAAGDRFIRYLRSRSIAEDTSKTHSRELASIHAAKDQTPTMGGLLIVAALSAAALLWSELGSPLVLGALFTCLACCAIGVRDDLMKMRDRSHGLTVRSKLALLVVAGLAAAAFVQFAFADHPELRRLRFPLAGEASLDLSGAWGLPFLLLGALVVVATANAVNLTDGLDGLASGCMVMVATSFALIAYLAGRHDFPAGPGASMVPGGSEIAVFSSAMAGACLGFLWFNCHPARVFMGDTGALALGGAAGYCAFAIRNELLLLVAGGVFVIEALSVILQVACFRLSGGKRIFRCAPLHHHFQFKGLTETQVTTRFWIVGATLALLTLTTFKVR